MPNRKLGVLNSNKNNYVMGASTINPQKDCTDCVLLKK